MAKDANGNDIPEDRPGNSAAPKSGTTTVTTGPGSETMTSTVITGVLKGLGAFGVETGKAAIAMSGLSYNTGVAAGVLGDFAGAIPVIGGSIKGFVGDLETRRKETNAAARSGLGGLDLTGLARQMKEGNLSVEQYLATMKKFGGGLQGLGGSVNETGNNLIQMGKDAREGKFGQKLTDYGITLDQQMVHIQAVGSLGAKNMSGDSERAKADRKSLSESNAALALEILNQAKVTGKSTEAITAELEERLRQPEVMARMRLMNEDQRKSFILTQAQLTGMGESAQKASANLVAGGKPTPETIAFLQTMKDGGAMFRRGTALATRGATENDRRAGRALLERSQVEQAKYQATPEYQRQMTTGDARGEAFRKAYQENQMGQRIVEILQKNPALTDRQALAQARKEAKIETVADQKAGTKTSPPPPGSGLQRGLNANEAAATQMNRNTAAAFDEIVKTSKGAKDLADAFNGVAGKMLDTKESTEKATKALGEFIEGMRRYAVGDDDSKKKTTLTPPGSPVPGTVPPAPKKNQPATTNAAPVSGTVAPPPTAPATAPATTPATAPKVETPTVVKPTVSTPEPTPGSVGPPPKISRKHTSLNETGSLIDNFSEKGTSVLAHQGEGVVNLAQLNNLASGSKNIGIETALASMQSMFGKNTATTRPTASDQPASSTGNVDFSKAFEGIATRVSSINTPKADYNPSEYVNSTLKTPVTIEEPKSIAPTTSGIPQQPVVSAETISLKDLNEQLMRLNTGIMQLVQHSAKSVDLNEAQVKATKGLSGNKFA